MIPTSVAANGAIVAGDALWVAGTEDPDETGGDTLLRLDPATAEVVSRIDVGGAPLDVATTDGLVWVATSEGLAKVDLATEEVDSVALGGPVRALAVSESTVWVEVSREGELDSEITAVDATSLEAQPISVSDESFVVVVDLATDGETVWASIDSSDDQAVRAFDATTSEPLDDFIDPWTDDTEQAVELEFLDGELWVCGPSLACMAVDPTTGEAIREALIDVPEGELRDLVIGEGSLWAGIAVGTDDGTDGDDFNDLTSTFIRIDPVNGIVLGPLYDAAYPVPTLAVGDGTAFLVAPANESRFERELVRIDLD